VRSRRRTCAGGADRSLLGLLISQTSRGREEILYMDLQSAGDHLNFGRVDGPSLYFSIFQFQNFTVMLMLCFGHPLMIPFLRTKTKYPG
jgi:hypothetical protein